MSELIDDIGSGSDNGDVVDGLSQASQGGRTGMLSRRNVLRSSAVGGLLLAAGSIASACGATRGSASGSPSGSVQYYPGGAAYAQLVRKAVAGRTLTLGFAPPIISSFFNQMEHAAWWEMSRLEDEFGVHWKWEMSSPTGNFNAEEQQISIIDQWVARGFDAVFVCTGIGAATMQPVYEGALKKGVAVFQFNMPVEAGPNGEQLAISSIGYSNKRQSGERIGDFIGKALKGSGTIIEMLGPPGSVWRTARLAGFERALKKYPGLRVVAQGNGGYVTDQAYSATQALLARYPHVNAIWAENTSMGVGVARAIQQAGMKFWDGSSGVLLASADGTLEGAKLVQSGQMAALVDVASIEQGRTLINTAFQYLALGASVGKVIDLPCVLYTKDNVAQEIASLSWVNSPPRRY